MIKDCTVVWFGPELTWFFSDMGILKLWILDNQEQTGCRNWLGRSPSKRLYMSTIIKSWNCQRKLQTKKRNHFNIFGAESFQAVAFHRWSAPCRKAFGQDAGGVMPKGLLSESWWSWDPKLLVRAGTSQQLNWVSWRGVFLHVGSIAVPPKTERDRTASRILRGPDFCRHYFVTIQPKMSILLRWLGEPAFNIWNPQFFQEPPHDLPVNWLSGVGNNDFVGPKWDEDPLATPSSGMGWKFESWMLQNETRTFSCLNSFFVKKTSSVSAASIEVQKLVFRFLRFQLDHLRTDRKTGASLCTAAGLLDNFQPKLLQKGKE